MNCYKEEASILRNDIDIVLNQLMDQNEDVLQQIQPELIEDYHTLKDHIHEQKDENEALYKQLLSLKKETASSAQKIALYQARVQRLEKTLGVSRYNEDLEKQAQQLPYKGSVYQTQTAGFNYDEDEQFNAGIS